MKRRAASPALKAGVVALALGAVLFFLAPAWAVLPPALFLAACLAAPFFPAWQFFGPVIRRGTGKSRAVALTFDDGPDPDTTPALLNLLARRGIHAAFFVTGRAAQAHPGLVLRALAEGHEIGNHSLSHDPLLALRGTRRLEAEIRGCQETLAPLGIRPRAFRAPVGILNPRFFGVLDRLGLYAVGFRRRAGDFGNRRIAGLAGKLLRGVRGGDVLLLHDVRPGAGGSTEAWLAEVESVLDGLRTRGLPIRLLSAVIGRPVMERLPLSDPDPGA